MARDPTVTNAQLGLRDWLRPRFPLPASLDRSVASAGDSCSLTLVAPPIACPLMLTWAPGFCALFFSFNLLSSRPCFLFSPC